MLMLPSMEPTLFKEVFSFPFGTSPSRTEKERGKPVHPESGGKAKLSFSQAQEKIYIYSNKLLLVKSTRKIVRHNKLMVLFKYYEHIQIFITVTFLQNLHTEFFK